MISGISHITFIVSDLAKESCFWQAIFDAEEVYSSGDKQFSLSKEKFFLIGDLWLCLMEGAALSERSYNHVAFKVSEAEYDSYVAKVKSLGVDIRMERPRVPGEGRSIYFYDWDHHLFELHTGTLAERLKAYME